MSSEFHPGDVVRLKSGSPPMTVMETDSEGYVSVTWFDSEPLGSKHIMFVGDPHDSTFPEVCLHLDEPPPMADDPPEFETEPADEETL